MNKNKSISKILMAIIILTVLTAAVSSCSKVVYDPANRVEPVTISVSHPV